MKKAPENSPETIEIIVHIIHNFTSLIIHMTFILTTLNYKSERNIGKNSPETIEYSSLSPIISFQKTSSTDYQIATNKTLKFNCL